LTVGSNGDAAILQLPKCMCVASCHPQIGSLDRRSTRLVRASRCYAASIACLFLAGPPATLAAPEATDIAAGLCLDRAAKLLAWVSSEASKGSAAGLCTGGPPGAQALEQLLPAAPEPSRPSLPDDKGQKKGKAPPQASATAARATTPQAASSHRKPQSASSSTAAEALPAAAAAGADANGAGAALAAELHRAALEAQQLRVRALLMEAQAAHLQWEHSQGLALALAALQGVPEQAAAARRARDQLSADQLELLQPTAATWVLAAHQAASAYSQLKHHDKCLQMASTIQQQCTASGELQSGRRAAVQAAPEPICFVRAAAAPLRLHGSASAHMLVPGLVQAAELLGSG
jgi:hypothetical protein